MRSTILLVVVIIFGAYEGACQETVFGLLKKNEKLADRYFEERNFQEALNLFQAAARKNPRDHELRLKIARCHYFLKQYPKASDSYEQYLKAGQPFPPKDLYYYAETYVTLGDYKKAVEYFRQYLVQTPNDSLITEKIWRLDNIQYLYEDSLQFAVRSLPQLNTANGELCPVPYNKGLLYISNRKEGGLVEKIDASQNMPFYRIYFSPSVPDTTVENAALQFGRPTPFNTELSSKFHAGPLSFYDRHRKMVFTTTSEEAAEDGGRGLQLYFAELRQGRWKPTTAYPYNSKEYSITDPSISEDGKVLYFSSDMETGLGGQDLYRSEYANGQWTKPVNLGNHVNTPYDEVFPYLHGNTLYFSSNGHPGMGGLDIFKVMITSTGEYDEVTNAGYPVNSNYDEFGIVIDSINTHGFFSSNRKTGGYNDDIYEFDMDLQTYPLEISGWIRQKEYNWSDSSDLKVLPNAKLYLIDNIRNVNLSESVSDSSGNFSIVIPWFSTYRIRVVGKDNDEHIVSLEIPKHRKLYSKHEIVIVKDTFKSSVNPSVK